MRDVRHAAGGLANGATRASVGRSGSSGLSSWHRPSPHTAVCRDHPHGKPLRRNVGHCPTIVYRGIIRAGVQHVQTAKTGVTKGATQKVSYRLPDRVGMCVNSLAQKTGWSESYAAGFLVSLGYAGLRGRTKEVEARRRVVAAQVALARVHREAVEDSRKVRAAKKSVGKKSAGKGK